MKLIGITSESCGIGETKRVIEALDAGFCYIHVRKPSFTNYEMNSYLKSIPQKYYSRITLGSNFALINDFPLGGIHLKQNIEVEHANNLRISRSCHTIEEVAEKVLKVLDKGSEPLLTDLKYISGMGQAKATAVLAALELGRRRPNRKTKVIRRPEDIWNEVKHYAERNQEQLLVLSFNGAGELLGIHVATVGLVDKVVMHPREIFAEAIKERAVSVVIVHNHPSGQLSPSQADRILTKRISTAGKLLGIKVLDHLIISTSGYYSFREMGEDMDDPILPPEDD